MHTWGRLPLLPVFETIFQKIVQFTLSLLFLHRKKINLEKFQKGLLINYTVQPTGVLLISSYLLT